jgi:hypothetical protein
VRKSGRGSFSKRKQEHSKSSWGQHVPEGLLCFQNGLKGYSCWQAIIFSIGLRLKENEQAGSYDDAATEIQQDKRERE